MALDSALPTEGLSSEHFCSTFWSWGWNMGGRGAASRGGMSVHGRGAPSGQPDGSRTGAACLDFCKTEMSLHLESPDTPASSKAPKEKSQGV